MTRWLALTAALALVGCFDSLVTDHCVAGFHAARGTCTPLAAVDAAIDGGGVLPVDGGMTDAPVDAGPDAIVDAGPDAMADAAPDAMADAMVDAAPDAMVDAAPDAMVDAAPDAMVCSLPSLTCGGICTDVTTDPNNCGGCGRICPSGVCAAGLCTGTLRGHIIAIGHDYRSFHPAMARVLGNSVALGAHFDVAVSRWHGTAVAASTSGTTAAINASMTQIGRPWHEVALPASPAAGFSGIDVLVIDAQTGDGAAAETAATAWRAAITSFVAGGGVVIVLEGASGVSYRFAIGANLYTVGAPVDATGSLAMVVDGADVTTQQVVSPYLAEITSVTIPGAPTSAIDALVGGTIVFHLTR